MINELEIYKKLEKNEKNILDELKIDFENNKNETIFLKYIKNIENQDNSFLVFFLKNINIDNIYFIYLIDKKITIVVKNNIEERIFVKNLTFKENILLKSNNEIIVTSFTEKNISNNYVYFERKDNQAYFYNKN